LKLKIILSGDVPSLDWENLALQPYFSATAANVGYGYWSNDITGPGDDMELYLRWV
jgi:alpha-glucosidase (family GH31 glycosyl hydrolase)